MAWIVTEDYFAKDGGITDPSAFRSVFGPMDANGTRYNVAQHVPKEHAPLIAAAPGLLEALKATLPALIRLGDFIGNNHNGENGIPAFDRCGIIAAARAAIAKAEGR